MRIKQLYREKAKYVEDIVLNILANAIPLITLQLLVLPKVNSRVGEEYYGLVVTIVSVLTFITSTSANSLNNVRLLLNSKYEEEKLSGDFNIIQTFFSFVNAFLVVIVSLFYTKEWSFAQAVLLIVATILICSDGYYSVGFRLQLNYRRILVQKILLTVGYIIGYFVFTVTDQWLFIYICGYLLDLCFVLYKTDLIREPWIRTKLFKESVRHESVLIVSSLIGGISTYIDRLIIYPIYGGLLTSTYYVATLLGKGISLATYPISGVLLSYFSKKTKLENSTVKMMTIFSWVAGIIGYVGCMVISRPLLSRLYPAIVDDAMRYVPVTLIAAVINVQNTIMSPVVLKFCNITWQIVLSVVNVVGYLIVSVIFMKYWGLMGFCVGGIVTSLIKYIIYLVIYIKEQKKKETD